MELRKQLAVAAATVAFLPGCTGSNEVQELPRPTGILWETNGGDRSDPENGELVAAFPLDEDSRFEINPNLSEEHTEAIEAAFRNPILNYAIESGYVSSVTVRAEATDSAGFNEYDNYGIDIDIGDRVYQSRLYTHDVAIDWAVTHETAHSIFKPVVDGINEVPPGIDNIYPESLRNNVLGMIDSCSALSSQVFESFIIQNQTALSEEILEVGLRRLERGESSRALDGKFNSKQRRSDLASGSALVNLAEDINDDGYSREIPSDIRCRRFGIGELMQLELREVDREVEVDFPGRGPEGDLLNEFSDLETEYYRGDSPYACVTDGKGIDKMVDNPEDSKNIIGWPYGNISELIGSSFAMLYHNPLYLQECIEKSDSADSQALIKFLDSMLEVLDYKDPRVLNIIGGQSSDHYFTLDWIRRSADAAGLSAN